MKAHGQGLGESRVADGHVRRHGYALRRIDHDGLGKAALHVRRLAGAAHEEDGLTEILAAFPAELALAAEAGRVHGHLVAGTEVAGARGFDHLAGDLVAEDQRLGHDEVAGPAVLEIVQVGAADAAGGNPHAHAAMAERLRRPLLDTQVARAVQDDRAPHVPG
jgi:hypothetical protein